MADTQQVLAALAVMQSSQAQGEKAKAHEYLEAFQKSVSTPPVRRRPSNRRQEAAWQATMGILSSADSSNESKLFAATTLKGKVGRPSFADRVYTKLPRSHTTSIKSPANSCLPYATPS